MDQELADAAAYALGRCVVVCKFHFNLMTEPWALGSFWRGSRNKKKNKMSSDIGAVPDPQMSKGMAVWTL